MLSRKCAARDLEGKLLNKALSWCRAQGADAVILWATPESRSLYRRCGLVEPADILEAATVAISRLLRSLGKDFSQL